jgi:uncharacterized protein (DUF1778 family)
MTKKPSKKKTSRYQRGQRETVYYKPGQRPKIKAAAKSVGESTSQYLITSALQRMEKSL